MALYKYVYNYDYNYVMSKQDVRLSVKCILNTVVFYRMYRVSNNFSRSCRRI